MDSNRETSTGSYLRPMGRRSFLKTAAAASVFTLVKPPQFSLSATRTLESPPSLSDLASDRITHRFCDLYNLPTAQNEWGYAQGTKSVSGLTGISLPPFGCCGVPKIPWSPGLLLTCEMFLDGKILMAHPSPADEVSYVWFPHCFVRECEAAGLRFTTTTFMPAQRRSVAQVITVNNVGATRRNLSLGFDMRAGVASQTEAWFTNPPGEGDNAISWAPAKGCLIFEAQHSHAVSVQGLHPNADRLEDARMLVYELSLGPGEAREFHYINAIEADKPTAMNSYSEQQAKFAALMAENERAFTSLIRAAFTPGNADFSGHLPRLITDNEDLWNLYHAGFRNLLSARRAAPNSAYGTTYITLGGHVLPTLSFPWDTSLTSLSLALLDPMALRRLTEDWFIQDMHQHLATDYLTGKGVGPWYGVNDMAILRCAENYLRVTGDFGWLDSQVGGKAVIDHLLYHALYWKALDHFGHGLGDYGNLENLLEVVSTYLHEVAGINAGNVSGMRFVVALLERRGNFQQASQLRAEAKGLAERINRLLYVAGKGYWRCGQPGDKFNEVRHCYDLLSVLDNMFEDLSAQQKKEMNDFFWKELHSAYWMRALSPKDVDATWNIRPDHSWLGAYASWPPMTAKGLYKIAPPAAVAGWLRGVSRAGNQGPIGQAHFVESVFPLEHGGAYKCPNDPPYINDWCCIAGGAFLDMVIDSIFGVDLTLQHGLHVESRLLDFDPHAKLENLGYQGAEYTVSAAGAVRS